MSVPGRGVEGCVSVLKIYDLGTQISHLFVIKSWDVHHVINYLYNFLELFWISIAGENRLFVNLNFKMSTKNELIVTPMTLNVTNLAPLLLMLQIMQCSPQLYRSAVALSAYFCINLVTKLYF